MNLVILPQASAELRDAVEYYEGEVRIPEHWIQK